MGPRRSLALRAQLCELLVEVPEDLPHLSTNLLAFGRMPTAGEPEVLAGCQVSDTNRVNNVKNLTLKNVTINGKVVKLE